MNVLGLNGLGHNPSACLIVDNSLKSFASEERFNRTKDCFGIMPLQASAFCLKNSNLSLKDIHAISFGWNSTFYNWQMPLFVAKTVLRHGVSTKDSGNAYRAFEQLFKYRPTNVKRLISEMFRSAGYGGELPPIHFTPHHLAHAASVYYTSGFDSAHVLVIDGSGENRCTSIFKATGSEIKHIKSFYIPNSLGWFYQSITEWLGFTPSSHEGKTMALAAYGNPNPIVSNILGQMLEVKKDGTYLYHPEYSITGINTTGNIYSEKFVSALGKARAKGEPITDFHRDVAYAAQHLLESAINGLVQNICREKDFNGNLCIAGGVALNCKMNGKVAQTKEIKQIFVSPVSGDEGVALGASLISLQKAGFDPRFEMTQAYYGPSYKNEEVESVLINSKVKYSRLANTAVSTAELLANGKTVGWFQGAMEVGARALGNRSILANPAMAGVKDKVNKEIKNREQWRPFAASILYDSKDEFVINGQPSPFMTIAFDAQKEALKNIQEAIHIDGTIRPQFVTNSANPLYYQLIKEFGKITGINALLNTSLNTNEEPIVCTPQQALKAFFSSGLDALVIGDFLLEK